MAQSVCEIMWISQLLMKVGIKTSIPAKLWCDNKAAKHIEIDFHFVHGKIQLGLISTRYVMMGEQQRKVK